MIRQTRPIGYLDQDRRAIITLVVENFVRNIREHAPGHENRGTERTGHGQANALIVRDENLLRPESFERGALA